MKPRDVWSADSVYLNGKVLTFDASDAITGALAVKGDRILAAGSDSDVRDLAGASTEVIDLRGGVVVPGINDSHCHAAAYGANQPPFNVDVGFPAVKSIADIKQAVRQRAARAREGEWIRGSGWDCGYLAECLADRSRSLTRWDLDEASSGHPAYLTDSSHHRTVANSRALELAGITRDTTTLPGSVIVKDPATGEPTGELVEMPAQGLLMRVVPSFSRDEKRAAITTMMRAVNARGITSLTEAAVGPGGASDSGGLLGPECISVYNDLHNEGMLSVRVNLLYLFGTYGVITHDDLRSSIPLLGVHSGFGDEWLKIGGIKVFADGIPQTKTAWLHDDYVDGGRGGLVMSGDTDAERCDELAKIITFAHESRFQIGIHVVGDRAIEACVDALLDAQRDGRRDLRHYLIHADFPTPGDIRRMAANNIGVTAQPILKWVFADEAELLLGRERAERQFPLRSLLDAGVHVSLSSDAPVTEPDWLRGVEAACIRRSKASGRVSGEHERITVAEAIRGYTMGGAWQDGMEERKGSLEPGKLADFCVLDRDILTIPVEEISHIATIGTVVGGRIVHDAGLRR